MWMCGSGVHPVSVSIPGTRMNVRFGVLLVKLLLASARHYSEASM